MQYLLNTSIYNYSLVQYGLVILEFYYLASQNFTLG